MQLGGSRAPWHSVQWQPHTPQHKLLQAIIRLCIQACILLFQQTLVELFLTFRRGSVSSFPALVYARPALSVRYVMSQGEPSLCLLAAAVLMSSWTV